MADMDKHRLYFEDESPREEEDTRWIYSENAKPDSGIHLDEAEPGSSRRGKWVGVAVGAGILLVLISFGVFTYLYYDGFFSAGKKQSESLTGIIEESPRVEDTLKDRIFFPRGKFRDKLQSAISQYEDNRREDAKRSFEKFLDSPADDREKSIALIYSGIMAMETERWAIAENNLRRALKYNPDSVAALINLAIVKKRLGNTDEARKLAQKAKDLAPNDPDVGIILGNLLAETQDLDSALDTYRDAVDESPDDPTIRYNLALALLRKGNEEEAVRNFAKVIDLSGGGELASRSHSHLGRIYFSRGNLEMAADHLKKAATLAPDNGRHHYNLGIVYLQMKRNEDALREFNRALDAGDNDADVFRGLATAFTNMNQPSLAIRALKKAIYMNPQDIVSLFQLGDIYAGQQDLLNAADTYRKIVNITPGNADTQDALLKLGVVYMDLERHMDAVEVFERVLRIAPGKSEAMFGLGAAYQAAGMTDKAVQVWKAALTRKSDGIDQFVLDREGERSIRMALADVYRKEGAYESALNEYRLIQALNMKAPAIPDDPELDMNIAQTRISLQDYSGAKSYLENVSESPKATPEQRKSAFISLARIYLRSGTLDDIETARSWANRAARFDPVDQNIRILQSEILLKSGSPVDREKAIEILRAVTASDIEARTSSKAYDLLGRAYMENGEYSRAVRSFDYAVQLDPSNTGAYEKQREATAAYERSLQE